MYYVIINPAARSGKGRAIWSELEQIFLAAGIPYSAVYSKGPGHVSKLVEQFMQPSGKRADALPLRLIILGGDGTINEALQGISDFEQVLLGYIPTGSSNDLARDLKLPKDPAQILHRILEGKEVRRMDLGVLTLDNACEISTRQPPFRKLFAVSCGMGFDAAVCVEALTSRYKQTLNALGLGKLTYLAIALKQLFRARRVSCELFLDDRPGIHFPQYLFCTFMNHKYEGGGFMFCPDADCSDGLLDLCLIGNLSKATILLALPTAFFGKHYIFKEVRHFTASNVRFTSSEPLWVHTDGEVSVWADSICVRCEREKIRLMM